MKCIVIERTERSDSSLHLRAVGENDHLIEVRIPGILKSKKRTAYYYYPGSQWNFIFANENTEILYPRESELISTMLNEEASYNELLAVQDLLFPLKRLPRNFELQGLYKTLAQTCEETWKKTPEKKEVILYFYLSFLEINGLLHSELHCESCGREIHPQTENTRYSLEDGFLCSSCMKPNESLLDGKLVESFLQNKDWNGNIKFQDANDIKDTEIRKFKDYFKYIF